jgi:curved DNA-binding protein CbpA
MVFLDYYAILEVSETATQEDIKATFKRQALKWHPDRNPGQDTTIRMQQINEAYLILKDIEARERYNIEYQRYKAYERQREEFYRQQQEYQRYSRQSTTQTENKREYSDYQVNDDVLNNWIKNAQKQSVGLAKRALDDLLGTTKVAGKAIATEFRNRIGCFVFIIVGSLIFYLIRTCNSQNYSSYTTYQPKIENTIKSAYVSSGNGELVKSTYKPVTSAQNQIDTLKNDSNFERIMLTDIGYISIPKELELQSGHYKEFNESFQKMLAEKFKFEIADKRIVFQQKGLNELEKEGFASYVRVIIETQIDNQSDYLKQSDDFSATAEEQAELNSIFRQQTEQSFRGTNLRIIQWENTSIVNVNQSKAIKISYVRQLNDNPTVHVDMYQFHNNDRMHTITISYQQKNSNKWKPLLDKVINSFHLTNKR